MSGGTSKLPGQHPAGEHQVRPDYGSDRRRDEDRSHGTRGRPSRIQLRRRVAGQHDGGVARPEEQTAEEDRPEHPAQAAPRHRDGAKRRGHRSHRECGRPTQPAREPSQPEGACSGADDEQRLRQASGRIRPCDLSGEQCCRAARERLGQTAERREDAQVTDPPAVRLPLALPLLDGGPD